MKTIFKIAWRNVWRNKLRSGMVITSIALGIWSGLFVMSIVIGLNSQRMNGAIKYSLSHTQIHNPKFLDDYNKKYSIENPIEIFHYIENNEKVKAYSARSIVSGMASTARGSEAILINGIDTEQEKQVTAISESLVEGTYLNKFKKNPVLIGKHLADKLGLKVKSKIIINFQDKENNVISSSFRVEGIYKSNSDMLDALTVFVRKADIDKLAGLKGAIHEIALVYKDIQDIEKENLKLKEFSGTNQVQSWAEISPELGFANEFMSLFVYIFMGIILLALAFGVINTMLMAVLERKRELGMLMSVGMNKKKLFYMIMYETLFLSLIAAPIGIILSIITINYFGNHGIDLTMFAEGLGSLGIGSFIYTSLTFDLYINIIILTIAIAFGSSIFPALRALKLNPAESVRAL